MSSTDQPPAKRKRAEDTPEDTTSPGIPVKSSIWYHDGNVILQAEGTQWKVHQGILAESSSVFRDMFSLPQPPSHDTVLVEGCPVVKLSDTAEEVEYVLQAICKREYVGLEEALPLPVISAFIRLGRKYDIRKLFMEGQKRIFHDAPTKLAQVDTDYEAPWKLVKPLEHCFELVVFARTTGLLSILPYALYMCQHCPRSEITRGATRKDGTIVSLSVPDQLACLTGFQAICKAQAETTFSWAYAKESPVGCTGTKCSLIRQGFVGRHFTSLPTIAGLSNFNRLGFLQANICSVCVDQADERHNTGREEFWALLPSLFGLPPWEELYQEQKEVYV